MPWRVIGQETIDVKSYFCDGCGGEFEDQLKGVVTGKEGSLKANFDFGYLSSRDGERYSYFFCQNCAEGILTYIGLLKKLKETAIDV
jgi:hypothetical protein